jgi:hypothetical protein
MSEIIDFDAKRYPEMASEYSGHVLLTVLTKRIEGTFKAYAAIVPDVSIKDPSYISVSPWVRSNGNPLRFKEAHAIWAHLSEKDYAQ